MLSFVVKVLSEILLRLPSSGLASFLISAQDLLRRKSNFELQTNMN